LTLCPYLHFTILPLSFLASREMISSNICFWGSLTILELGDKLINCEKDDLPGSFPLTPDGPSNNCDRPPGSPDLTGLPASHSDYSPPTTTYLGPAWMNSLIAEVCRGNEKEVIISNPHTSTAAESNVVENLQSVEIHS
jgi:hypothetical protein